MATGAVEASPAARGPGRSGMVLKARLSLLCRMVTFREPPVPRVCAKSRSRAPVRWALTGSNPRTEHCLVTAS